MEPQNHVFEKEKHLNQTLLFGCPFFPLEKTRIWSGHDKGGCLAGGGGMTGDFFGETWGIFKWQRAAHLVSTSIAVSHAFKVFQPSICNFTFRNLPPMGLAAPICVWMCRLVKSFPKWHRFFSAMPRFRVVYVECYFHTSMPKAMVQQH